MRTAPWLTLTATLLILAGCEELAPVPQAPPAASAPATNAPAESPASRPAAVEEVQPSQYDTVEYQFAPPPQPGTSQPQASELIPANEPVPESVPLENAGPETAAPETAAQNNRIEAQAGVGQRGQSLTPGKIVSEPARAYFRIEQKVIFTQVEHALQLYKATNGSVPQSTEEYMEQIVKPNGIVLPKLPQGHRYVFDPQQEKLMVEWTQK